MATYVIPAVYDTVKKQIRPIGASEKLLPEYFGMRMSSLLSSNPGQALRLDASGLLYCAVVSKDSRNLIVYGSDHGAYLDTSQILSNAATNLLTTSPTDFRVTLTKKTLLDAGFADASAIYAAVQQHIVTIHEAKEAAATSAAQAKTYSQTVSRLITEAEAIVREEAAGIAAESITGQVVQRAAEAASQIVDTRQDRELATLTMRIANAESKHSTDVANLTQSISDVSDGLQTLNVNWTQNFTQVTRTNVEQSELISQLFEKDNEHDERLNFLKCSVDALDARVYQNFVCLVYRIAAAEERVNDRIDREVNTLNSRITLEVTLLNTRIDSEVSDLNDEILKINATQAAAWTTIARTEAELSARIFDDEIKHREDVERIDTRIDREVDTFNSRITTEVTKLNTRIDREVEALTTYINREVARLDNRITTEVTRLDEAIIKTNAVVAEGFTKVARTEAELSARIFDDEIKHREDVERIDTRITTEVTKLNTRIDREVDTLNSAITKTNAVLADSVATLTATDVEQAVQLIMLRKDCEEADRLLTESINATDRRLSEAIIDQKRFDLSQTQQITKLYNTTTFIDRRLSEAIVDQKKSDVEQAVEIAELRIDSEEADRRLTESINATDRRLTEAINVTDCRLSEAIVDQKRSDIEQAVEIAELRIDSEEVDRRLSEAIIDQKRFDLSQTQQITKLHNTTTSIDRRLSESIVNQKRSDIEQAALLAELRIDTDSTDRRLSENIVMQNKRYIEQSETHAMLVQHQLNDAVRFSDLSYASVLHTRKIMDLDEGFVTLCANVIKNTRTLVEQALMMLSFAQSAIPSGSVIGSIDAGILG